MTEASNEILVAVENGIGTLTINRPGTRNALTPELLRVLIDRVGDLNANPDVRVIALTGAGKAFCAGADMSFLDALTSMSQEEIRITVYGTFQGATRALKMSRKPTVAVVNGHAIGAGCELAVACDFRLVARDAYFSENWIDLGIMPPLGGTFLLPRLIGLERATNMVMRATRVYGEEAVTIGLASQVDDKDALPKAAAEFMADLVKRPAAALSIIKQALRRGGESSLAAEWEFNVQAQSGLLKGPDFEAAVAAIRMARSGG